MNAGPSQLEMLPRPGPLMGNPWRVRIMTLTPIVGVGIVANALPIGIQKTVGEAGAFVIAPEGQSFRANRSRSDRRVTSFAFERAAKLHSETSTPMGVLRTSDTLFAEKEELVKADVISQSSLLGFVRSSLALGVAASAFSGITMTLMGQEVGGLTQILIVLTVAVGGAFYGRRKSPNA